MIVKLCGFTNIEDLDAALALGVDAIGLNLVPSSPRVLREPLALELAGRCTAQVVWVVDNNPAFLPSSGILQRVSPSGPCEREHWDVVRLVTVEDVERAAALPPGLLLCDAAGSLGGSGKKANWHLAAQLQKRRPLILAGGLTPDNVAQAIAEVQPHGVDVSSGIESAPGKKDKAKMAHFVARARGQ